jgi:predicted nucleic acid-binding protein
LSVKRVAIDSDVILDHLYGRASPSVLRQALGVFFCYTTVFQAAEVLAGARGSFELRAMQDAMGAVKLLGVNARGAMRYAQLLREHGALDRWTLLVAGLCLESRLPLVSGRGSIYGEIPGLLIIPPQLFQPGATRAEILAGAQA